MPVGAAGKKKLERRGAISLDTLLIKIDKDKITQDFLSPPCVVKLKHS